MYKMRAGVVGGDQFASTMISQSVSAPHINLIYAVLVFLI